MAEDKDRLVNLISQRDKYLDAFLTDKPLEFSFAPDTGLISLVVRAGFGAPGSDTVANYMPVLVMLTPESAQSLLDDLPKVAEILGRAKEGITKPRFLQ